MSLVRFRFWAFQGRHQQRRLQQPVICGCSSMVEHQPSKLDTWVRFPSPASDAILHPLHICDSGVVGNARPCQGRDRGFEPRLSLSLIKKRRSPVNAGFFFFSFLSENLIAKKIQALFHPVNAFSDHFRTILHFPARTLTVLHYINGRYF